MKKTGVICISVLSVIILPACFFIAMRKIYPVKYTNEISTYANQNDIPPYIIASLVNTESSFDKNAYSNKKAIGLMQIKLSTAEYMIDYYNLPDEIDETQLFDVETNLKFGCLYLKYLQTKFKNLDTAFAAYNAGETVVRSWLKNEEYSSDGISLNYIPYQETAQYLNKINKNIKQYKKIKKFKK